MASQPTTIVYLKTTGFDFYSSSTTGSFHFDFQPTIVRDLDVLDKIKLEEQIKAFFDQNQILKGNVIIVLSDTVYFEKDFIGVAADQQETVTRIFLENIPFENISSKSFPIENGFKIAATNKDFYESIKQALEKCGFIVEGVTPSLVVGGNLTDLLAKYDIFKQNSFIINEKKVTTESLKIQEKGKSYLNKKIIALGFVFFVFLLILIFMLVK